MPESNIVSARKIRSFLSDQTGTHALQCYPFFTVAKSRARGRHAHQLGLGFARVAKNQAKSAQKSGRGGRRVGAGRPLGTGRRNVRHRVRESHRAEHPLHVVLRSSFQPLRSQFVFPTLRAALARATRARADFRVVHFSVQLDHLHLIVEASTKTALARGMQGLAIRIAKQINVLVGREGKVWADRFYSRALTSPRTVHHAIGYVLGNFRKHAHPGTHPFRYRIDPYSSAPYFAGFVELHGFAPRELAPQRELPLTPRGVPPPKFDAETPCLHANTWLAKIGWKRGGLLTLA